MDYSYTSMCQGWPTNKELQRCVDTGCSLKDLLRVMDDKDERESQVTPYCQNDLMMIKIYILFISILLDSTYEKLSEFIHIVMNTWNL